MHDIKWIRSHPEAFDLGLKRRGLAASAAEILALDKESRGAKTGLQQLKEEANALAKKIGELKMKGQNADAEIARSKELKQQIAEFKDQEGEGESAALTERLSTIPNILLEDVPEGKDESQNVELRKIGTPPTFDFTPKSHDELGEALGLMDFTQTAKIAGARFTSLKGNIAKLHRALADFMLNLHTREFGFQEVVPPLLVRPEAMFGTGQYPKFREDSYETTDGRCLIPTSEVPLTNMVADTIVEEKILPLRLTALTPCFRSEAGSAGKDTRGMLRQHQFYKVEMVSITHAEQGIKEHDYMTACAEEVLKRLGLAYRVVALCSGDTGFSARKTYDIEVWVPSQNTYREISSCSYCGDFQARRMKARYRAANGENLFVHTLNGSGVAVGRALIAVMENYQQKDGSIRVPEVLKPYLGVEVLR